MNKKEYLTINEDYAKKYKLDDSLIGKRIVLYDDRINHLYKHTEEFSSKESFKYSFENLSDIICCPDFINKDTKQNSLKFVKKRRTIHWLLLRFQRVKI